MPETIVIEPLTPESLADAVAACRHCLYWESPSRFRPEASGREQVEGMLLKRRWLDRHAKGEAGGLTALLEGKSCGHLFYVRGSAANDLLPRLREYALGPRVAADALFLTCLYVPREAQGKGISRALLAKAEQVARELGLAALETIARRGSADNPSGPLEFYLKHGFAIEAETPEFPLVRKSLS